MKKLLAFLLVLALAVCMLPGLALAEETAPTFDLTKDLEDITIPNDLVTCICTTTKESKQYGQLPNGFSASIVIKEGDVWTVIISVVNLVYKEQFDNDTGSEHTQDNNYPNEFINQIQFKLKYEGNKWVLGGEMPKGKTLHFTCKDNHTVPQPDKPPAKPEPENTSKPVVGLTGEEAVKVHCTTNAKHAAMRCDLLENSFDIGVVTKDETSGEYFCNITVHADKYVEKYNEYLKGHTLETEGQTGTITLNWDAAGKQWKYTENKLPITFTVKCETVPQETYYIVTYTDGVGGTAFVDQAIRVKSGDPTPAFNGTPSRSGYTFTGWTPAVTDTVTDNVTYTAQWKNNDNHTPGGGNGGGHWHPTTTPVPVIVIPPKTGDMTIWQSILHFLGIR